VISKLVWANNDGIILRSHDQHRYKTVEEIQQVPVFLLVDIALPIGSAHILKHAP
jgi:hypothetical protein